MEYVGKSKSAKKKKKPVLWIVLSIVAIMNSFQLLRNVMIATVAMEDFNIGVMIWNKIR